MSREALWVAIVVCSCSRPQPDAPKIVADPVKSAGVDAGKPPKPAPEEAFCESDAQCGWDDPCDATACVAKSKAGVVACEESAPKPGRCVCSGNRCAVIRNDPSTGAAKTGCTKNAECVFVPVTGSCRAGAARPMTEGGASFCRCDAGTCTPELVAPVPCKKTTDCSWLDDPWRPAPASKVPRPHPPIVPCKTGGRDSVCDAGSCVLRVWKC